MRSIAVYFRTASDAEVTARLDALLPGQRDPWLLMSIAGDPVLYVHVQTPDELREWTDDIDLPFSPVSAITADVSGRHSGDEEVRWLVRAMLDTLDGVAGDEWSPSVWTREDVQRDVVKDGHPFFDYKG